MFHEHVRTLIERQCRLLREETDALGKLLAEADPDDPEAAPLDVPVARRACQGVAHRAEAMGIEEILERARALDRALAALEPLERIRCRHMVEVMALQGDLAAAVDELEAESTGLYAGCTTSAAAAVAPPPAFCF